MAVSRDGRPRLASAHGRLRGRSCSPRACAWSGAALSHLQVGLYAGRRALLPRTAEVERTLAAAARAATRSSRRCRRRPRRARRCSSSTAAWSADDRARRATAPCAAPGRTLGASPDARGHCSAAAGVDRGRGVAASADVVLVGGARRAGPRAGSTRWSAPAPATSSSAWSTAARSSARSWCPGTTACLRCIDAHLSSRDPDHVTVTSRYVAAPPRGPRDDGVPDVADPALVAPGAWPGRCATWSPTSTGRRPATWSRPSSSDRTRRAARDRAGRGIRTVDAVGLVRPRPSGTMVA